MTICFVGNVKFSREMLKHLLSKDDNQIVGIITKENSNFNSDHSNLSDLALENKVPFNIPDEFVGTYNVRFSKRINLDVSKIINDAPILFYRKPSIIAQEVETMDLPGMVVTRSNGYKGVKYERLIPLLLESIKSLQDTVAKQQEQINQLMEK